MKVFELVRQLKAMSLHPTEDEKKALALAINIHCAKHNATLNFNEQNLRPIDIQNLCAVLKTNTTVQRLNLNFLQQDFYASTPIQYPFGIKALKNLLSHNTTLTSLSLDGNKLSSFEAIELFRALDKNHNSALTTLSLDSNEIRIHETTNKILFKTTLVKTKLKKLSLKENDIDNDFLIWSEEIMKEQKNSIGKELDLTPLPTLLFREIPSIPEPVKVSYLLQPWMKPVTTEPMKDFGAKLYSGLGHRWPSNKSENLFSKQGEAIRANQCHVYRP